MAQKYRGFPRASSPQTFATGPLSPPPPIIAPPCGKQAPRKPPPRTKQIRDASYVHPSHGTNSCPGHCAVCPSFQRFLQKLGSTSYFQQPNLEQLKIAYPPNKSARKSSLLANQNDAKSAPPSIRRVGKFEFSSSTPS